jgi:catechol 2,3-dioxygenase-like lactoylglutathione lyase family enzyme
MRLDHIAYRVKDRNESAQFFIRAFGYEMGTEFQIDFEDGSCADCVALTPPEIRNPNTSLWTYFSLQAVHGRHEQLPVKTEYHAPPEIFVSDGSEGSIVGDWVAERGGIGGIHHMAYQVEDVLGVMNEWKEKGYAEFYSEEPITCKDPNLTQVFTKPSKLTGVIYEFINREGAGFCKDSVKELMKSTKDE